jgi:hypothetical protein
MKQDRVKVSSVVQLSPEPNVCRNPMFAGCFLVVTELKSFGVQGYVTGLGKDGNPGGQFYYRANWDEFEGPIGDAIWIAE